MHSAKRSGLSTAWGAAAIAVCLAACGGGGGTQGPAPPSAQGQTLTIVAGTISAMAPVTAASGSSAVTLSIAGSGLQCGGNFNCRVNWAADGQVTTLGSTVLDDAHLTASVPAELLRNPVYAQISIETYDRITGDSLSSNLVEFSVTPTGSTSTSTGRMSTARSGHTAVLLASGEVLILGGGDNSAEIYDPASGAFSPTANRPTEPYYTAAAARLPDGKVFIVGGASDGAEIYDPNTRTFAATGPKAVSHFFPTATLLNDGRVLLVGGIDGTQGGGAASNQAELFDPVAGTFTLTGHTISQRADHTATLLSTGEVLIVGGWNGHASDSPDDPPWDPLFAELYNSSSGQFQVSGKMTITRIGHSATALPDGRVLVLGGINAIQNVYSDVNPSPAETYDPPSGSFTAQPQLGFSRIGHTATVLKDGSILIIGGDILGRPTAAMVQINPQLTKATVPRALITGRTQHTATRLQDGRVLITGGMDDQGNVLATAEICE